jgi:hypothetical protein
MTITLKKICITCISIKVGIIAIVLLIHLTIRWLLPGPPWRRPLFKMFNSGDQTVNSAHQLIKFLIDVGALVIKKPRKLIPGHHSLKSKGDSTPFPDPDMVRRQQKTTPRYYPYQLTTTRLSVFNLQSLMRDTPKVVDCRWGVAEIRNLKVQGTQDLDRFRPPRA